MRKHFLLLFLMALLPLAGWAQGTSLVGYTATVADMGYNGNEQALPTTATLKKEGAVDIAGATIDASSWKLNGASVTKATVAGTYTFKANKEGCTDGPVDGELIVTKKLVTVTAKDMTIKYGSAVPAQSAYTAVYDGFVASDEKSGTNPNHEPKDGIVSGTIAWSTTYTAASNAGTYKIHPDVSGLSADNYRFTFAESNNLTVSKKNMATDFADFTVAEIADRTFAGLLHAQKPLNDATHEEIVVNFGTKKLVYGTDYTVKFYDAEHYNTTTKAYDGAGNTTGYAPAGTYYVQITGAGTNYEGVLKQTVPYVIKKAPLLIKTKGNGEGAKYSNVYGEALAGLAVSADYVELQGNLDNDDLDALDDDLQISLVTPTGLTTGDAGTYTIKVSGTKSQSEMYANYIPSYSNQGIYEINKRALTFKVKDQFAAYGEEDPYVAGFVVNDDDLVEADLTSAPFTNHVTKTAGSLAGTEVLEAGLTIKRANTSTAAGSYDLTIDNSTVSILKGTRDVTANYNITLTKGTFTIETGLISIVPKDVTDAVYGDADKALDCEILNMRTEDMTPEFVAMVKKALYIDSDSRNATEVGYKIKVNKTKIVLSGDIAENYSSDLQCFEGKYYIKKRDLTKIEVLDQSLNIDDFVTDLDENKVTFTAKDYTLTEDDIAQLQNEFKFVFAVDGLTWTDAEITAADPSDPAYGKTAGQLKAAGTTADAIRIDFDVVGAFTNFNLPIKTGTTPISLDTKEDGKYIFGKLTVSAAADVDLDAAITNNAIVTALNNKDGKKVDVNIKNREFKKEVWTVLVLPFATTVREISNAFDYAVVDVLDQSKGDAETVYFKLWMGEIPANTPFMIKTDANVLPDGGTKITATFAGKTIVKCGAKTANTLKDAGDNIFYGVYQQTTINKDNELHIGSKSGKWGYTAGDRTIDATKAYIEMKEATGNARVFIEEPDGTTTAITVVSNDAQDNNAEGWYNINGVRMQSVPTVKGLYIHNGKKVVIK